MAEGLTKAQTVALSELAARPQAYADHWPPIKKLVALGLAERKKGRFSDYYRITKAGREALIAKAGEE